jgi:hypothetical protein
MSLIETLRSRPRLRWEKHRSAESLDRAARAIHERFPEFSKKDVTDLDEKVAALEAALANWEWEGVTAGDVALVARAVLQGEVRASSELENFIQREVSLSTNTALLRMAAEAYFDCWQREDARSDWLAGVLKDKLRFLPARWRHLLGFVPEFLDTRHGPELVAARMVSEPDPYSWLTGLGLHSPHTGPLMRQVHLSWLNVLPEIRTLELAEQVFSWIRPVGQAGVDNDAVARAIEKLLHPWHTGAPADALREFLLDRIIGEWGDPRNKRAEFWSLVDPAARNVIIRWLAGESMDALLTVISKSTGSHMWPPRHHFWKGLYNRGLVDEAWIALSPQAAEIARRMHVQTSDPLLTMFGRQVARGRKETCLLIMRIGSHVVVEGSHDYRVHLFSVSDRRAPQLYQERYDAERLTFPAHDPMARMHDQHGHWQKWVTDRVLR